MSDNPSLTKPVNKLRNIIIAIITIVLSIALVLGSQTSFNDQSLEAQAEKSMPLEVALNNNKPTLMEFYANWCTSCQAMASDLAKLKQEYQGQVNFVMLNVDNSRWLPEVLNYHVDGIPHFVFFNQTGSVIAESIGEQPLTVFQNNLQALVSNQSVPYASRKGNISNFNPEEPANKGNQDSPLSHGG